MKFSSTLLILLATATLFQGCGETEEAVAADTQTVIQGSATLGTILNNDATVCIDMNNNAVCDDNEPTAETDSVGQYKFIIDGSVEDGTLIIAQNGVNLLPPPSGEHLNLKFYKSYQSSESDQNVNVFSTLVVNEMQNSLSSSYAEAIETVVNSAFANSTYCSFINSDLAIGDPISDRGDFLTCMIALQDLTYLADAAQIQMAPALQRVVQADTSSDLDGYIEANTGYFESFLTALTEYLDAFYAWWDSLWADDGTVVEETPVTEEPPVVDEPAATTLPITRSDLNGVWYIIDASGDKTCSDIDSADNISVTEADGKTTDLTLTYEQNGDLASMKLSLSFFSVDTIVFTEYKSDDTFKGYYASDNETLSGEKVSSLDICKSEKLGL